LGCPPLVQQFETTVFRRVSVKALLSVASVWAVVGIPAVSAGFAPAVPLDAVLLSLFVANPGLLSRLF